MLFVWWIRVPKTVPLLELKSSKGGTKEFQRWNFSVPPEELFNPYGGIEKSLGRNSAFPTEENKVSSVGNLFFQGRKLFGKLIGDSSATGGAVRKPYKPVAPLGAETKRGYWVC